jgi:hypothetical protein
VAIINGDLVGAVDVGPRIEQQVEHVAPPSLDGDVQGLRPPAPERMRPNGVDELGRIREHLLHLCDASHPDMLEEHADDIFRGGRRRLVALPFHVSFQLTPTWKTVLTRDGELRFGEARLRTGGTERHQSIFCCLTEPFEVGTIGERRRHRTPSFMSARCPRVGQKEGDRTVTSTGGFNPFRGPMAS